MPVRRAIERVAESLAAGCDPALRARSAQATAVDATTPEQIVEPSPTPQGVGTASTAHDVRAAPTGQPVAPGQARYRVPARPAAKDVAGRGPHHPVGAPTTAH